MSEATSSSSCSPTSTSRTRGQRAAAVARRIGELLDEPIAIDSVELRAKACIGVAIYPTDSRDAKGLLAAADAAMYASKHAFTRVA